MEPETLRQLAAAPAHPLIAALWWAAQGEWHRAHAMVMDDASADAAWIHAWLHRQEGDLPNARYWYNRAGRPAASDALTAEWDRIAAAVLRSHTG